MAPRLALVSSGDLSQSARSLLVRSHGRRPVRATFTPAGLCGGPAELLPASLLQTASANVLSCVTSRFMCLRGLNPPRQSHGSRGRCIFTGHLIGVPNALCIAVLICIYISRLPVSPSICILFWAICISSSVPAPTFSLCFFPGRFVILLVYSSSLCILGLKLHYRCDKHFS